MNSNIPTHPVRLTAMTLRGMGSYLHGARLELRPLTILCGKNGSGKSTWSRMLKLLKESHQDGLLPFKLKPHKGLYHDETNAYSKYFSNDSRLDSLDPGGDSEEKYGPFGTIGLEFESVTGLDLTLPAPQLAGEASATLTSAAHDILWLGKCCRETRFRLRIAHPISDGDFSFDHLVQLSINDLYTVDIRRAPGGQLYAVSCSPAILQNGSADDKGMVPIAELDPDSNPIKVIPLSGAPADATRSALSPKAGEIADEARRSAENKRRDLSLNAVELVRQLLSKVLEGCFEIGAVRKVPNFEIVDALDKEETNRRVLHRQVGAGGEFTAALAIAFSHFRMLNYRSPWTGYLHVRDQDFDPKELNGRPFWTDLKIFLAHPKQSSAAVYFFESADPYLQSEIQRLLSVDSEPTGRDDLLSVCLARLFNAAMSRRDLYNSFNLPEGWLRGESQFLIERGVDTLDSRDVRRLNRLLIENLFPQVVPVPHRRNRYAFATYMNFWLEQLTETQLFDTHKACAAAWEAGRKEDPPHGFLALDWEDRWVDWRKNLDGAHRFSNGCFGNVDMTVEPDQLSAGFHQIAPIIVQLGLMRRHELLTLENPEVHLHPSLQLEISEFLAGEAKTGKYLLIETHSDLVVQRIMFLILDEKLRQEEVRLYFTQIVKADWTKPDRVGFDYSELIPLEVDNLGRINNWPPGFMDDDVKESRRLLDKVYGHGKAPLDEEDD